LVGGAVEGPGIAADVAADTVVGAARVGVKGEIVVDAAGLDAGGVLDEEHGGVAHDGELHESFVVDDTA